MVEMLPCHSRDQTLNRNHHFSKCFFIIVLSHTAIALLLNCNIFDLVKSFSLCIYFAFIVISMLISKFSTMSKRKGKKMKSSSSIEEFWAEFNIPMSIGLGFLEEKDVNLVESSLVEDELFLPMGYFEAGLRLPLPLLFRDLARHLQLTLNQFYVNIIRLIISMVVLDHIKGLHISTRDVMYIYHAKRSCILYEWYLFPQSGMGGFIIGGLSTNKEVNREIIVVSGHWEFGASKPEELLRASWVHGILSK